jgi:exosome complex component RRP41
MEFVSPEGLRLDGRRPKELRRLDAKLDVLASADGSAIFEMGNTKASVRIACTAHTPGHA